MVLRGDQRGDAFAIGKDEERKLFPLEKFFQDNAASRSREYSSTQHLFGGVRSFFFSLGDHNAFASGESIGFDDERSLEERQRRLHVVHVEADGIVRRRNIVPLHEFLSEALAALKLRSDFGR